MTTQEESEVQNSQSGSIPITSSSPQKCTRGPNGRFCSGGRSDANVTSGAPLPSPATPPSQIRHHSPNPFGPSTSAGPILPRRFPVRTPSIFDPTLVILVFEMYFHSTTPLFIYQYTAMCTGFNNHHDFNNECNLQPMIIGTDLDMPASYSKQSIPLPTLSWGQPPQRNEPNNEGRPVSARFIRYKGAKVGYFLRRIQQYLAPNQYNWRICFKFQ
jgi:hypothetical protein